MESFPKTLENLLEYLRYTKLINDDKKQKYEQLLFDEENSIESLCKKKGKIVEFQRFWPKYFEEIMISSRANFDIVSEMFNYFKEYLGNEEEELLLSKYNIFLKLKEIFFGSAKDFSFDIFNTLDKKQLIIKYLEVNRADLLIMKEELLKALVPIFKEIQNYYIKTSFYEEEDNFLLIAQTFKYVKEKKMFLS